MLCYTFNKEVAMSQLKFCPVLTQGAFQMSPYRCVLRCTVQDDIYFPLDQIDAIGHMFRMTRNEGFNKSAYNRGFGPLISELRSVATEMFKMDESIEYDSQKIQKVKVALLQLVTNCSICHMYTIHDQVALGVLLMSKLKSRSGSQFGHAQFDTVLRKSLLPSIFKVAGELQRSAQMLSETAHGFSIRAIAYERPKSIQGEELCFRVLSITEMNEQIVTVHLKQVEKECYFTAELIRNEFCKKEKHVCKAWDQWSMRFLRKRLSKKRKLENVKDEGVKEKKWYHNEKWNIECNFLVL